MKNKQRIERRKPLVKSLGVAALLFFTFSISTVSAQESVNATLGDASGSECSANLTYQLYDMQGKLLKIKTNRS